MRRSELSIVAIAAQQKLQSDLATDLSAMFALIQDRVLLADPRNYETVVAKSARGRAAAARFKKKYPDWDGESYNDLAGNIIRDNYAIAGKRIAAKSKRAFESAVEKVRPKKIGEKKLVLSVFDPVKSQTVIKAKDRGEYITEKLRKQLAAALNESIAETGIDVSGRFPPDLENRVRRRYREIFAGYTRGPGGVPPNLETIVVTESRSAVNNMRLEYARRVAREVRDRGVMMKKRWLHFHSKSRDPREPHARLHYATKEIDEKFNVNGHMASGPHDSALPPGEFINCHCELDFYFVAVEPQLRK